MRRNKSDVEQKIAKEGLKNVHVLQADVTDPPALKKAAEDTAKITGGSLDILYNNAARMGQATLWKNISDLSPEELQQDYSEEFKVDVLGVAYSTNAFLPLIRKGETKKVITLATGLADLEMANKYSLTNAPAYSIAKAAQNMLVGKYNAQLGKTEGILFLSLSPGMVDTGNTDISSEEAQKGVQEMVGKFLAYDPSFKGPITVEESVRCMTEVVDKATVESMGAGFVSHHGDKNWL